MALEYLAFDYAALFLMLVIVMWYFLEKRIPLESHKIFLIMLTTTFVATGMEIFSTRLSFTQDLATSPVFWVSATICTLAVSYVPIIFSYYIHLVAHVEVRKKKLQKNVFAVCLILNTVLIATNPFHRAIFDMVDNRRVTGLLGIIPVMIAVLMFVMCVASLIVNTKQVEISKLSVLIFNILSIMAAFLVQYDTRCMVLNFILATVCLTLYYNLHNPASVTDAVTHQFNRQFFGYYVTYRFDTNKNFGIILIAMDDFKFINKTYGVKNGDNLLRQVGTFLEGLKLQKNIFRYGADQFAVVTDKNIGEIADYAGLIHERFLHPWYSDNQVSVMMSASICYMECPRDAKDYGSLVETMDYAMSVTKKEHKGSIVSMSEVDLGKIQRDKAIEKAVKQALDKGEFMVYYQPIYSVEKKCYNSAEALVRLHDETLGWISPEEFIPISEKNGLIVEMGEDILEKVCRFIHDFNLSSSTVEYIEVNISPIQLMQQDFSAKVKSILEKYDVRPEQINMEITETATMGSGDVINENIGDLVDYGIKFSLDDYGSGNANIDYINRMPFSIIKLDKYIVWDAFENKKANITLQHTIGMLNELELNIIAEGVETEEMRDHLIDIGCHYMQGWFYSKAVSDTAFMQIINEQ